MPLEFAIRIFHLVINGKNYDAPGLNSGNYWKQRTREMEGEKIEKNIGNGNDVVSDHELQSTQEHLT